MKMEPTQRLKVVCGEDCGNAPKKAFIKSFNVAFARGDVPAILEQVTPNIVWHIVGDRTLSGSEAFVVALEAMSGNKASELHLDNIITHGNVGSANGAIVFGRKRYAFCDVYHFGSFAKDAKIKRITSYVIEEKSEPISGRDLQ